mmetsp:Transcript_31555/g.60937  ORF Transcript_31555/g.60937 Transcript_31555/m.60937 type:complete len:349 (+) Transcript_31555:98-1144(+)|eukprot:CAMPEP_0167778964 /NCGR_PEP_ID=MMETSP0111_2-20121227/4548_1 /TAXON_ID=91324 /ORGANISM="Lotharella globosa, Strain CCCM811" /LENGTH=348 /DNA_ID=CAMNT_0007669331 /DNA_START=98 /DNA_END=1144 /DNA_ORIENTATION=+
MPLSDTERPSGAFARYKPKLRTRKEIFASARKSDKNWKKTVKVSDRKLPSRADPPKRKLAAKTKKAAVVVFDDVEDEEEYEEEYEEILVPVDEDGNEITEDVDDQPSYEVLVKNLDLSITNKDLCLELFGDYDVESVVLHQTEDGHSRGVAEVQFSSKSEAEAAVRAFNGSMYKGKKLRLILLLSEVKKPVKSLPRKRVKRKVGTKVKKIKVGSRASEEKRNVPVRLEEPDEDPDEADGEADEDDEQEIQFTITDKQGLGKRGLVPSIGKRGAPKKTGPKVVLRGNVLGSKKMIVTKKKGLVIKKKSGVKVNLHKRKINVRARGKKQGIRIKKQKVRNDLAGFRFEVK